MEYGIFDICFQRDSKLKNLFLLLSIITRSGFSAITRRLGGTVPPPRRVWDGLCWKGVQTGVE